MDKNMKIAYIYPELIPSGNARSISVINTIANLSIFADITLYCEAGSDKKKAESFYRVSLNNVKFVYISKKSLFFKSNYFFNKRLINNLPENIDFIYTRHLKAAKSLLSYKRRNGLDFSIVFEAHEIFFDTLSEVVTSKKYKIQALKQLEQYVYKNVDAIVFSNQEVRRYCNIFFNETCPKQKVAYNGSKGFGTCKIKDFSKIDGIYYIGSLFKWKGVDELIKAFSSIPSKQLYIVGDGERLPELQKICSESKIDNIVFLGRKSQNDVFSILREESKVCIIPNSISIQNKYSVPIKLFEYLNTANIVIAPDMPTILEIDKNKDFIYFFEHGNNDSMLNVLQAVFNDEADILGEKALLGFESSKKYTWQARANEIFNFLKDLNDKANI